MNVQYKEPRDFDGTPYEAAEAAIRQARALLVMVDRALEDSDVLVRNSFMSRNIDFERPPDAAGYEEAAEHRAIQRGRLTVSELSSKLKAVERSASYDPKNPPKEEPS